MDSQHLVRKWFLGFFYHQTRYDMSHLQGRWHGLRGLTSQIFCFCLVPQASPQPIQGPGFDVRHKTRLLCILSYQLPRQQSHIPD